MRIFTRTKFHSQVCSHEHICKHRENIKVIGRSDEVCDFRDSEVDTECCSSLASSSLGHGQAEESTKTLSRLRIQPINIPGKYERNHNRLEIIIVSTSNHFQSWPYIGVGLFTAHPLGDRLSLQRRRAAAGACPQLCCYSGEAGQRSLRGCATQAASQPQPVR